MLMKYGNGVVHPVCSVFMDLAACIWCGCGWFNKICQPCDLSHHAGWESAGKCCFVHYVFVMYSLYQLEVLFTGVPGFCIWWVSEWCRVGYVCVYSTD